MPLDGEPLIGLKQLATELLPTWPVRETGKRPTYWSLYKRLRRYVVKGQRGVRLEATKYGGIWATSHAAWKRFNVACTDAAMKGPVAAEPPGPKPMTERQREAHRAAVRAEAVRRNLI